MNAHDRAHAEEHAIAERLGFYPRRLWWIDSFKVKRGEYYRYTIAGRNDMREGETIHWSIPSIVGQSYAFALRVIAQCGQPIDAAIIAPCEKPAGHAGPCRAFSLETTL
jgi:hypothetical protein